MTQCPDFISRRSFTGFLAGCAVFSHVHAVEAALENLGRIITPAAPGSSTDLLARLYAERMAQAWNRPVIVEPVTGANGVLAVEAVLRSRDDSVFFGPAGILTVTPLIMPVRFDAEADLIPLALGGIDFLCVASAPTIGVGDLRGLVELARKRPGFLNVAAGPGGPYMVLMDFLRQRGIEAAYVPYKSPPDAVNDLLAGRLHVLVGPLAPVLGPAAGGKVRILAVTNPERSPVAPTAATTIEQGFPELELEGTLGFFISSRASSERMSNLAGEVLRASRDPNVLSRAAAAGIVVRSEPREAFEKRVSNQRARWRALVAQLGTSTK